MILQILSFLGHMEEIIAITIFMQQQIEKLNKGKGYPSVKLFVLSFLKLSSTFFIQSAEQEWAGLR